MNTLANWMQVGIVLKDEVSCLQVMEKDWLKADGKMVSSFWGDSYVT